MTSAMRQLDTAARSVFACTMSPVGYGLAALSRRLPVLRGAQTRVLFRLGMPGGEEPRPLDINRARRYLSYRRSIQRTALSTVLRLLAHARRSDQQAGVVIKLGAGNREGSASGSAVWACRDAVPASSRRRVGRRPPCIAAIHHVAGSGYQRCSSQASAHGAHTIQQVVSTPYVHSALNGNCRSKATAAMRAAGPAPTCADEEPLAA